MLKPPLVKSKLVRGVEMISKQPMEVSFKQFAHYGEEGDWPVVARFTTITTLGNGNDG